MGVFWINVFFFFGTVTATQYYNNLQKYSIQHTHNTRIKREQTHTHTGSHIQKQANSLGLFSIYDFPVGQSISVRLVGRLFLFPNSCCCSCCCSCNAFITYLGGSNVSRDVCSKNDWGQSEVHQCALFVFWCLQFSFLIACFL